MQPLGVRSRVLVWGSSPGGLDRRGAEAELLASPWGLVGVSLATAECRLSLGAAAFGKQCNPGPALPAASSLGSVFITVRGAWERVVGSGTHISKKRARLAGTVLGLRQGSLGVWGGGAGRCSQAPEDPVVGISVFWVMGRAACTGVCILGGP